MGLVVFVVAGFLLVSMGGAIVAAPATVPLMFLAARRRPTLGFRIAAAVLGSLTVAEAAWAFTYLAMAEARPWIWLLPALAGSAFAIAVGRMCAPRPQRAVPPLNQ